MVGIYSVVIAADWDTTLGGLWQTLQEKTRNLTVQQLNSTAGDATAATCDVQVMRSLYLLGNAS